jgi:hypothetical protein
MNFVMRIVRSGRSPLDFMFQKPSEICAAKRLIYNGPKNRVEVFGRELILEHPEYVGSSQEGCVVSVMIP